jgi:hypothetical protein
MTTKFEYQLNDETVQVEVTSYMPFIPTAMMGSDFGDCDTPQPIKFLRPLLTTSERDLRRFMIKVIPTLGLQHK